MAKELASYSRSAPIPQDWTEDHGERLLSQGTLAVISPPRVILVGGLLLLCLIPRFWAGTLHDIICPDTVSYIRWTNALKAGDAYAAFRYTGINIYQPILLGIDAIPGDWLTLAKWWSVAMATLTILPLYGWLRRQFNETLAIIGSSFYALHPAMIHDSPLIVRDPTFWFLFALGLYASWRAVSELRYRWFAALAIVFGLMVHLRTEAWLLVPLLLTWLAFRLRHAPGRRALIATTALLAVAVGPLSGWAIHKRVLANPPKKVIGSTRHLGRVEKLASNAQAMSVGPIVEGTRKTLVRYVKAFGYLPLVFAAAGVLYWRQRLFSPSRGGLLLLFILSAGAIWASFCLVDEMDRRYVFTGLIVALPTVAAGFCATATWFAGLGDRLGGAWQRSFSFWFAALASTCFIVMAGTIVASPRPLLYDHAEMGRWIGANVGHGERLAVNLKWTRLVEYYGDCKVILRLPPKGPQDPQASWLTKRKELPSVVLIWLDWRNPAGRAAFEPGIREAKQLGYREVPPDQLPEVCREILVLLRDEPQ